MKKLAIRAHTVRVSDRTWEGFKQEAALQGVSTNQWVIEAALGRLVHARCRRDDQVALDMDTVYEAIAQLRAE